MERCADVQMESVMDIEGFQVMQRKTYGNEDANEDGRAQRILRMRSMVSLSIARGADIPHRQTA